MPARLRSVLASVLLVVGVLLVPVGVASTWLRTTVTDTDSWVATVSPLATDPAVTALVEDRATARVMTAITDQHLVQRALDALENKGLPTAATRALGLLAAPLAGQVEQVVRRVVTAVVESDQFATAWVAANRVAHTQLVNVLSGSTEGALVDNGTSVSIDVANLVAPIEQRLVAAGVPLVDKLPPITVSVPLLDSADVAGARTAYTALRIGGIALPLGAIVLLGAGVAMARDRRRAVVRVGLGASVACIVLLLALTFARSHVASSMPSGASGAVVSIVDTVTAGLRGLVRVVVLAALVIVAVAVLVGPSRGARRVRELGVAAWTGARGGADRASGAPLALPVAVGVAVVCVLVVALAGDLGTGWTLVLVAVAAAALVVAVMAARLRRDAEVAPGVTRTGPGDGDVGEDGSGVREPAAGA
ncbi:hypothetical protein GCM10009868_07660 [Terrabacter aerolatus]|uniref:Integral membrane protein n=1 Tax=Terrabacter aerolatus TaxID=422442 RepID=A0A512D4V9_9MICO|nr:hypothetical protein [Terrabacter aerolatus]GEO31501.1 hypothetical protein TAE01_33110 [Terrabacter aerolatus]